MFNFSAVPVLPSGATRTFGRISDRLRVPTNSIRVRSDQAALDFLSSNQAAAATTDSSTILVRPEYRSNNFVLSHELVHIAQLRRGLSGSVQQSEAAAHTAATALLHGRTPYDIGAAPPPPLFFHFTGGAFDQALDNASIDESVLKRLNTSKAFLFIVSTLDNHYVWKGNKRITQADHSAAVNGTLMSGAFKGKRLLFIQPGEASFSPFGAPDNGLDSDVIKIDSGHTDLEAVRSIAHEATHAFRFVTGKTAPKDPLLGNDKPEKVEAAVQAGITEELETRKSEVNISEDVFGKRSREHDVLQQDIKEGYLSRPLIERDIAPGIGLTYLESSGFDALLTEAQATEKLSNDQARDIRNDIDKGPKKFPMVKRKTTAKGQQPYDKPSQYALIYKNRQIAIATWQDFHQKFADRLDSAEAQKEKERLLQENAHVLLDSRIQYSPLDQ